MPLPPEIRFRLWVPSPDEFYTQGVLETYDSLLLVMETRVLEGQVEMLISSSESIRGELMAVLAGLVEEVGLCWKEETVL